MTQPMFDTLKAPATYMASQSVLFLSVSGRTTGIMMNSGDSVLHTMPIFESYALPHAILHWDLAGCVLTMYLMRISSERGYCFTTTEEREIGRGVKEKLCVIAFDCDTEFKSTAESSNKKQTHVLSDGNNITVGAECIRRENVFPAKCHWQRSQQSPRHFFSHITKCNVDFQFFFSRMSCCQMARPCSKGLLIDLVQF